MGHKRKARIHTTEHAPLARYSHRTSKSEIRQCHASIFHTDHISHKYIHKSGDQQISFDFDISSAQRGKTKIVLHPAQSTQFGTKPRLDRMNVKHNTN